LDKRDDNGEEKETYFGGGGVYWKSIILLDGSHVLPARPSDYSSIETKRFKHGKSMV